MDGTITVVGIMVAGITVTEVAGGESVVGISGQVSWEAWSVVS